MSAKRSAKTVPILGHKYESSTPSAPTAAKKDKKCERKRSESIDLSMATTTTSSTTTDLDFLPMFDAIRYKTEFCKNFDELGECKFGLRCFYAHSEAELRPTTYKHRKHKTQLCKMFHEIGFCDFGSRCAFIHTKPDLNSLLMKLNAFLNTTKDPIPSAADWIHTSITSGDTFNTSDQINKLNDKYNSRLPVFTKITIH